MIFFFFFFFFFLVSEDVYEDVEIEVLEKSQ